MAGCAQLFALVVLSTMTGLVAAETRPASRAEPRDRVVGRHVPNFVLPDPAGKHVGLADFRESRYLVIVFLGTKCPVSNAYVPVLLDLQQTYREKRVQVIGINANSGEGAEAVARHVKEYGISFPVLIDAEQSALPLFGARRTSEVFVLNARCVVRYHGRIDDRFAPDHKRDEPHRHDLREALDDLLAGKKVRVATTAPAGCLIGRSARQHRQGEVTYSRDVAPILLKHCADCHHPGTAAPFSLLSYEDASDWSAMIGEVVSKHRMPPWHADPRFGHFANERRLTPEEIETLTAWDAAGAPEGDKREAPPAPRYAEGWRIGKPDVIFQLPREVTVPAKGKVAYQYFTTKTNFKTDVWVQGAEARPGNNAVVHHIIVFYRETQPGASKKLVWIASVAPGAEPVRFPSGLGRKIPAGAELVWQVHYTTSGKEEKDRSELGLVFCKEPPKHDVVTHGISNTHFKIPPGDPHYQVVSSVPVVRDAVVLALFPHMHLRGKDFEYQVIYPDGRKELLLSVPQYDFNWQNTYRLKEPLHLPQGASIHCVAHFDNSAENAANPDPTKEVHWGDQTWDEMMIGYIDYYWDDAADKKAGHSSAPAPTK